MKVILSSQEHKSKVLPFIFLHIVILILSKVFELLHHVSVFSDISSFSFVTAKQIFIAGMAKVWPGGQMQPVFKFPPTVRPLS